MSAQKDVDAVSLYQPIGEPAGILGWDGESGAPKPAVAVLYRWPDGSCLLDIYSLCLAGWGPEMDYMWGDYVRLIREESGPKLTVYYLHGGGV
jgi:hypothetical protein